MGKGWLNVKTTLKILHRYFAGYFSRLFSYLAPMLNQSLLKLLKLDNLVSNLTGYIETRVELMKLEVKEEVAKALTKLSIFVVLIALATLFVMFFSLTLALLIGEYAGTINGFAIVASFYFLLFILFLFLRKGISTTLEKKFLKQIRGK